MKMLYFDDGYDVAERMTEIFKKNPDQRSISALARYHVAREIVGGLIFEGFEIANVEIEEEMMSGYADEFIVTLDEYGICCEKAKRDTGYVFVEGDTLIIANDCNSALLKKCEADSMYEAVIGESDDDDEDDDCEDCDGCIEFEIDDDGFERIIGHAIGRMFGIF